jgi:hypothetical protein
MYTLRFYCAPALTMAYASISGAARWGLKSGPKVGAKAAEDGGKWGPKLLKVGAKATERWGPKLLKGIPKSRQCIGNV